jgi:hypothetical protein
MSQDDILAEIEAEIGRTKQKAGVDSDEPLEIEIEDEPEEQKAELKSGKQQKVAKEEDSDDDEEEVYSKKVQNRIKKLVDQRRQAELQTRQYQEQMSQLQSRLDRLEKGNTSRAEQDFQSRYNQTRMALTKAVEEGDTEAQVSFQEQLADMRAAMRIAEMQKQQQQSQAISPTVGRAQQAAKAPPPRLAMQWWERNNWFNSKGFERETNAARAIDVQLDIEGFDKESDEYYKTLDRRLRKMFPELNSSEEFEEPSKPKEKSRAPVAPTAGGSTAYKGNRVRMSQDQLRMARELGIRDEKSLKLYADEIRKQNRS